MKNSKINIQKIISCALPGALLYLIISFAVQDNIYINITANNRAAFLDLETPGLMLVALSLLLCSLFGKMGRTRTLLLAAAFVIPVLCASFFFEISWPKQCAYLLLCLCSGTFVCFGEICSLVEEENRRDLVFLMFFIPALIEFLISAVSFTLTVQIGFGIFTAILCFLPVLIKKLPEKQEQAVPDEIVSRPSALMKYVFLLFACVALVAFISISCQGMLSYLFGDYSQSPAILPGLLAYPAGMLVAYLLFNRMNTDRFLTMSLILFSAIFILAPILSRSAVSFALLYVFLQLGCGIFDLVWYMTFVDLSVFFKNKIRFIGFGILLNMPVILAAHLFGHSAFRHFGENTRFYTLFLLLLLVVLLLIPEFYQRMKRIIASISDREETTAIDSTISPSQDNISWNYADYSSVFTAKEFAIIRMTAQEYSQSEIARELFITVNTVKYHKKKLYQRLNIHSREELLIWIQNYHQ